MTLKVTDPSGESSAKEVLILAGNDLPEVKFNFSGNSKFYWDNSDFKYEIEVKDTEDGSINKGIDPSAVTFTADYLARGHDVTEIVQGHQANMEASAHLVGRALVENAGCKACHSVTEKSVGPSFKQVADKYAGDETVISRLTDKVIKGGSGVWGELMMSAHPQLNTADTEKMIRYILSLNGKSQNSGLPYKGTYALNKHKSSEKEGTYIFTASYTDRGADGSKPLTATQLVSLSYPLIPADRFTEATKTQTFLVTKDVWAALEEEMVVVLPKDQAVIRYDGIDFTEVGQIKIGAAVAPNYFSGGSLELHLGNEDGPLLGSADLDVGLTDIGFKDLVIDISKTQGVHDLVLKIKCKDETKMFAGLATLEFLKRK